MGLILGTALTVSSGNPLLWGEDKGEGREETITSGANGENPVSVKMDKSRKETLVIGRVSDDPQKHYKRLRSIVDYVSSHLEDAGIKKGGVVMTRNNREMIEFLKEGRVDWVTETPFSALLFSEEAGAEIILRRWKKSVPEYFTIFIVHKDSKINSLEELKGKKIAFEDPGSTSAYFIPLAVLRRHGMNLVLLSSVNEKPPRDKVGYVFAGGELNITTWVHKGLVDAGALSDLDWEDEDDVPAVFRKDLKIVHRTRHYPRALELVRKGLDPDIKKGLKEILLNAHNDPKAAKALRAYNKTSRFDEVDEEIQEGIDRIHELLKYIRPELLVSLPPLEGPAKQAPPSRVGK